MDSGEKRLNELGYKQELRREMTLFKTLAITFSSMAVFTGTPLYGQSLLYAGPASMIWGWVVVTFFTWFVGLAMAEICSSFPTTGSLYFWAAHLAGPKWGPFASWCCAWLETIGLISGIAAQAYSATQTLQMIILLSTGTNSGGGYFAQREVFLCMYIAITLVWAVLNIFDLRVIAYLNILSIWWQMVGGLVVIIMLPIVARPTQPASFVFTHYELSPGSTGISSQTYAVILSVLLSHYCLYGYDAAAHLTEETKGADRNGPIAILGSIGIISIFGWAYNLALTFSIKDMKHLYDMSNETRGALVPAQIIYDAFYGKYGSGRGAIVFLCIIWGSFFFCGLSVTTSAARVQSVTAARVDSRGANVLEKMGTTVMATNIDERVSPRILYDIFIQAGPVLDLHCPSDRETNKPKGFAFVDYETEEIASYAVKLFSGLVVLHRRTLKFAIARQGMISRNASVVSTPGSCNLLRPNPGSTTPDIENGVSSHHNSIRSPLSGSYSDNRIDYSYYSQERERNGEERSPWNSKRKQDFEAYPRKRTPS